ncbi:hypothetical protein V6N13_056550 [Hibiscus sabdariffa]
MCKCRSHGTFPLFGLQSSHLNICYYHQDLHRRPLRPGSRPGFYGDRRAHPTHRGLALAPTAGYRHSSPSFGSRQACSHSNPSQKIKTPWSVFQDGPDGEPAADARSTLVPKHAETARAGFHDRGDDVSTGVSKARAWAATNDPRRSTPRADRRTGSRRSTSDRGASPAPIRFPPDNFKHSLTLFSKSFSSFPRDTCSLPVSRPYLALDGIYRPIRAAFPNNPTRRQRLVVRQGPGTTGLSPSPAPLSRGLGPGPSLRTLLQTTIRTPRATDFSSWAIPGSLAVTKGNPCFDNDPSAGSPTETLLRLLLPLNDKVQWTSRDVAGSGPPTSPRSEHFTGPFNRAGGTTRPIKARSASPAVGTSRPVLTVRRTGRPPLGPTTSFLTRNQLKYTLLELELPRLLAPDLPSNGSSLRDLDCTHSNYQTRRARINQVAFLRDVRPAWSSTHYLGRGEAITRREHRSCRGTKCTSYERTGPRPYAHEIFRIRKHDRASMHRRSRIMSIDTLGTPGTTEVHQAATRSLDGQGMAIHPKFHRFRYATQDPYRTPWARRPQGEDIEE